MSCGTKGEHKVISAIGRDQTSNSPSVIRSSAWPDELVGDEQRLSNPSFLSVVQRPSRFLFFYRDTERRKETPYVASLCSDRVATSFVKAEISCDIGDFGFSKMVATRETATGMFVTFVTKSGVGERDRLPDTISCSHPIMFFNPKKVGIFPQISDLFLSICSHSAPDFHVFLSR